MNNENSHKYDDIINMPYIKSKKRPWMTMAERGARFSPFAALTGFEDAIDETAKIVEEEVISKE
ncbi:MAG: hypothetical protein SOT10_04035 [Oscillospiraceae bacterium]|nr:hypothetical protein [Oscillospiraceae bacterium]